MGYPLDFKVANQVIQQCWMKMIALISMYVLLLCRLGHVKHASILPKITSGSRADEWYD